MSIFEIDPPSDDLPFTAVAVGKGTIDHHSGILFFDVVSYRLKFTHLAFHNDLRCEEFDETSYGFVRADTTIVEDDIIAATCNNLESRAGSDLQYALDYSARIFRSGEIIYAHKFGGVTCSTFVLAAFAAAGLELIDEKGWPTRILDTEIQERTVELLATKSTAGADHVEAQRGKVGIAKRFRPLEVAAAAYMAASCPNTFSDLEALASEIQREFDAAFA